MKIILFILLFTSCIVASAEVDSSPQLETVADKIGFTIGLIILCAIIYIPIWIIQKYQRHVYDKKLKTFNKFTINSLGLEGVPEQDIKIFSIAGPHHHANRSDIGGFVGYIVPEPENPHDSLAIAIHNKKYKKLGYVPARHLDWFGEWSERRNLPCAGILYMAEGRLVGHVMDVYPCSQEFVDKMIRKYFENIRKKFGNQAVPTDKSLQLVPTDIPVEYPSCHRNCWIEIDDDCIEEDDDFDDDATEISKFEEYKFNNKKEEPSPKR